MRTIRAVVVPLAIMASVLLLGVAVYSPVLIAWSNRQEDLAKGDDLVFVEFSWLMRQADFFYEPLTCFHASMWGYHHHNVAIGNRTGFLVLVFAKKEADVWL